MKDGIMKYPGSELKAILIHDILFRPFLFFVCFFLIYVSSVVFF